MVLSRSTVPAPSQDRPIGARPDMPFAARGAGDGAHARFDRPRPLYRHGLSLFGAICVTVGLFTVMGALIAEDFTPQDKIELAALEINPVVEDVFVLDDLRKPDARKPIVVPPAPPSVDIPETQRPSEPIVAAVTNAPTLNVRTMIDPIRSVRIDNRDPNPLVRIPPVMPPRAERSGHCVIAFDISAEGKPFNVSATSCSQSLFQRPAVRSVQKWTYRPEIRDGRTVPRLGLQTRISFQLSDERGNVIPE